MLDIQLSACRLPRSNNPIDFLRIELCPLAAGDVSVQMTATTVHDDGPELLDQEVASQRVTSLDDVLSLIRSHITFVPRNT